MRMNRVLFFTPTIPRRLNNPFLDPVRKAHEKVTGVDERLIDRTTPVLSNAYAHAHAYALQCGFDWVLCVEDDEEPQPDIAIRFLEIAQQFHTDGIFMGSKRLREVSVYVPGEWKFRNNPPALNEKPLSVRQIRPNESGPVPLIGGLICTPMMYSPAWFKKQGLDFHGNQRWGKTDNLNWDSSLADDLFTKRLRFIACPTVTVRHWDEKTKQVFS
jgi:hypothetical protein